MASASAASRRRRAGTTSGTGSGSAGVRRPPGDDGRDDSAHACDQPKRGSIQDERGDAQPQANEARDEPEDRPPISHRTTIGPPMAR